VLRELGARVTVLNDQPDGTNINKDCGSLYPESMCDAVKKLGADIGIAHDGDGDRVQLCDETGALVDGDDVLAITGLDWLKRGELKNNTLVATVMSNLGLDHFIRDAGGKVIRTAVGDRYVLEAMMKDDLNVGGEQSGHMIFRDFATTGDGLIAALQVLRIMMDKDKLLSDLRKTFVKFPQVVINLKVKQKPDLKTLPDVLEAVADAELILGDDGRVLLRYSGTEPKVRLLIEGRDDKQIHQLADGIAAKIKAKIGA
jgi:phosphoglucosamine mutase